MKKTRNIFVLTGHAYDIQHALGEIQFKGTVVLKNEHVSERAISEEFLHNKSVVCGIIPPNNFTPTCVIGIINEKSTPSKEFTINIANGDIAAQFEQIANKCNCDIGDHKTNDSGYNVLQQISHCNYCQYLAGKNKYRQFTLYSSEHFFVYADIGQFVPGYLLVVPFQHVTSTAMLAPSVQAEMLTIIEDIRYILHVTYGYEKLLVWENGTGDSGKGKAKDSLVHAHVHIAPSNMTAETIRKKSGFIFRKASTQDLSKYAQNSYLLIQQEGNNWLISDSSKTYIPRQYIRQLLADEYHIPGERWNWRKYQFYDEMQTTSKDIIQTLKANWKSLPYRIKERTQDYLHQF
ncbi:MAG: hypothetical protein HFJ55_02425 [Clostridia bacterium]|nr:hypothetical protein [Clostridia bacterium]